MKLVFSAFVYFKCITIWARRFPLILNCRWQMWHWNGFSPVWLRMWFSKKSFRTNALLQIRHVCLRWPSAVKLLPWESAEIRLPVKIACLGKTGKNVMNDWLMDINCKFQLIGKLYQGKNHKICINLWTKTKLQLDK